MDQKVYKQSKSKGKKKKDNLEESEQSEKSEVNKKQEIKIGKKALRKMLRLYISPKLYGPEEIEDMIWEVDEDMDGRVSKYEMEKMYKRCIVDKQELEPKKLFYFIMFLMFDKENKRSINEEDTLELLRVRNRDDKAFNAAIDEIFNPDGKKKAKAKNDDEEERITFEEYVNVMTNLVLKKRDQFKDKRENYCNHIQDELKKSNSVSKYK
jgi:Ca2+-binding EF-hand superfamily protein